MVRTGVIRHYFRGEFTELCRFTGGRIHSINSAAGGVFGPHFSVAAYRYEVSLRAFGQLEVHKFFRFDVELRDSVPVVPAQPNISLCVPFEALKRGRVSGFG